MRITIRDHPIRDRVRGPARTGVLLALLLALTGLVSLPGAHAATPYDATWGGFGAAPGRFDFPWGIAVSPNGRIYVADRGNHRIQVYDASGGFVTAWGTSGAADGQFARPTRIAFDGAGNVYVTDTDNHRIQKFTPGGVLLAKWGTNGSGPGQFVSPLGIAVDDRGSVYVADTYNHRLQRFALTLPQTLIASGPGLSGPTATFAFASTPPGAGFSCALDSGSASPCPSSMTYADLGRGPHSLIVTAIDAAGDADATPATRAFTVDAVAPQVGILKPGKRTRQRRVRVSLAASEAGVAFVCKLDRKRFRPCASSYRTPKLRPGRHTLRARAIDSVGNLGPVTTRTFRVRR